MCCYSFSQGWKSLYNTAVDVITLIRNFNYHFSKNTTYSVLKSRKITYTMLFSSSFNENMLNLREIEMKSVILRL